MKKGFYSFIASGLSLVAVAFASVASIAFIHNPEVPEELLKGGKSK